MLRPGMKFRQIVQDAAANTGQLIAAVLVIASAALLVALAALLAVRRLKGREA